MQDAVIQCRLVQICIDAGLYLALPVQGLVAYLGAVLPMPQQCHCMLQLAAHCVIAAVIALPSVGREHDGC